MWKFAAEQDYHQWLIFSLKIISDMSNGWVTCIGWIITDYQRSCYTLNSVWELGMHNHGRPRLWFKDVAERET